MSDLVMLRKQPCRFADQNGFTLIELIMVMVLVGILAVVVIPRLANKATFDARGFFDQSLSMIRYAQKVAVAQRTDVYVNVNAGSGSICLTYLADPACGAAVGVLNPADQKKFSRNAPGGVSFGASVSFSFNGLGKPNPDVTVTVNVIGDGMNRPITVERETGYVH